MQRPEIHITRDKYGSARKVVYHSNDQEVELYVTDISIDDKWGDFPKITVVFDAKPVEHYDEG